MWQILLYIILGGLGLCVLACAVGMFSAVIEYRRTIRDARRSEKKPKPDSDDSERTQVIFTATLPCGCHPAGIEHVCKSDPIVTAQLQEFEARLAAYDPKWYAAMSKRLKAPQ